MDWILIDVQVLHEGRPAGLGRFVPPGSPADEGVETGDERLGVPNLAEHRLYFGVGADVPGSMGMAAAVGDEKTDRSTPWPIFVIPGGGVVSLDAASQCL